MRARYYDTTTGQFLTRDPLLNVTGAPYNYASNDPINWTDPTGLCPWCALAAVGAAIGGTIGGVAYAVTTDDFSWRELGGAVAGGAVAGAVTAVAGPAGGSLGLSLAGSSTGVTATAATLGIEAAAGAVATNVSTGIGQGRMATGWETGAGALGGVAGAVGGRFFATTGMNTLRQWRFAPQRLGGPTGIMFGRNGQAFWKGALVGGFIGATSESLAGATFSNC